MFEDAFGRSPGCIKFAEPKSDAAMPAQICAVIAARKASAAVGDRSEQFGRKRSSFPTLSGCGGEAEDVNRFDEIGSHIWLTI